MKNIKATTLQVSLNAFTTWLAGYGETSYDFQTVYAGRLGGAAKKFYYRYPKLGVPVVAPMVFTEAFVPALKVLFWHKQRFPIADAHYAMGFSLLYSKYGDKKHLDRTRHFIKVLRETRCRDQQNYCWGYPFAWQTKYGTIPAGTPLITTTPYAYEAFESLYNISGDPELSEIMQSIANHATYDIKDRDLSEKSSMCSYTPDGVYGVINANAYRAFLLTSASVHFSESSYWTKAVRNLNYVLDSQRADGAWLYSYDGVNTFVDHYHTCFVLKALAKIDRLTGGHRGCQRAIERGVRYYLKNLFDVNDLPKPFAQSPRLTVYRKELYDYAECINLCLLLRNRFDQLHDRLTDAVFDILNRWQRADGSFHSRQLLIGWDNIPMHRWAQAQLFRSLCACLHQTSSLNL